uniref:Odorant receptor n=1 Tax=Meteorus pulchricornis TaxID=51522 RepID=A0A1S5VFI9_9HYME|nr:olfactory receptor 2 [Meteorus pulchricornis]
MEAIIEFDEMIRPISLVNRLISIWPLELNRNSSFESRMRPAHRVLMFILVGILSVSATADIIRHWGDMNEVTECALIATAFYLSMLRLVVYTSHKRDLEYAVNTVRVDWSESCEADIIVLREKCLFGFQLAKYFIVSVVMALGAFMISPALQIIFLGTDERILPFRGFFFQNQTNTPYYECLYVFDVIAGALGGSTISGATSLNLMLVTHGAAKFSLVRKKLQALKSNDANVDRDLEKCVRLHQEAILFADRAEDIINVLALGQFVISTGLVCFAGFQITSMIEDKGRMMKYVSFINSAILELFLFSYSGNQLITESEAVGESFYQSDWVGGNYMQNMRILMLRSINPSRITAGKFYDMSLKSFSSVLSTSFTYFTVLQAVNED